MYAVVLTVWQTGLHSVGQGVGDFLNHSRDMVLVKAPSLSCDDGHIVEVSPRSFLCWADLES